MPCCMRLLNKDAWHQIWIHTACCLVMRDALHGLPCHHIRMLRFCGQCLETAPGLTCLCTDEVQALPLRQTSRELCVTAS